MATNQWIEALRGLRGALYRREESDLTDGQLLEDFVSRREGAALEVLVERHSPMVWGVCRRLLHDYHDAEDAFQVTFLVFLRKAASIAKRELLANWLYGVAYQTARKARATAAKQRARERRVAEMPEPAVTDPDPRNDLQLLLDRELSRLPDHCRAVLILCDLEGKTRKEAARQLGLPEGTVGSRLARARAMLAKRLARHGLAVSGGTFTAMLSPKAASALAPSALLSSTIRAVRLCAVGQASAGQISVRVAALTEGVLKTMLLSKLKIATAVLVMVAAVAVAFRLAAGEKHPPEIQQQEKPADPPGFDEKRAEGEKVVKERKFVLIGTVRAADGKTPLSGVEVRASAGMGTLRPTGKTTTDKNGKFRLTFGPGIGMAEGKLRATAAVHVLKPGWYGWSYGSPAQFILTDEPLAEADRKEYPKHTNLTPGKPGRLIFRMEPAASLKVSVVDGAGKPMANTPIYLTGDRLPPASSVLASGRTDAAGVFTVEDIPRNAYRLVLEDRDGGRGTLELGAIQFRDAAEYTAVATIHAWGPQETHVSFKATRGRDR